MHSLSILMFSLMTTILVIFSHLNCDARDSISGSSPLVDGGDTLVSAGRRFELGFFNPQGSKKGNRYVGIWYYGLAQRTVVWVANGDQPLNSTCGSFGIADDGNVKIWCRNEDVVSIAVVDNSRAFNVTLQLLDSGNLILASGRWLGQSLWQSFDNPTDTLLPGMKLFTMESSNSIELFSWKSSSDPGRGSYIFKQDQGGYSIWNTSTLSWRSGEPGSSTINTRLPPDVSQILAGSDIGLNQTDQPVSNKTSVSFGNRNTTNRNNSRLVMNSSGEIQYYVLDRGDWALKWSEPENRCSIYNVCGKFGICNSTEEPICSCPLGFKPASLENWSAGEYSNGCDRNSTICSPKDGFSKKKNDEFLNLTLMEALGQVILVAQVQTEEACKEECLNNCKCEAYSFTVPDRKTGESPKCWIWSNEFANLHQDYDGGKLKLSLRIHFSDTASANLDKDTKAHKNELQKIYVIVITVLVGVTVVSCSSYILYQRRRTAGRPGADPVLFSNESERQVNELLSENNKPVDVPCYNLEAILSATDNFSEANKLGQGGFGPVYKGKFGEGREIAVKRLSSCSSQGMEEFLNEVVVIAKLQHRNLVRLLGYCIKENEKILLYEYMPNRSLDAFIFDQQKCLLLDWKKRFDIILGIARGLLYLHHDSRLRIIHRDLKTSNILLDEEMNPKISDFGLARIVEGKGTEASTNKVVGTYGYMSPEYALDGKFSIKSDVFSFGVVMLEIISGKNNTGFYNPQQVLNLIGYAWRLWSENKALDLVDPTTLESCEKSQVIRCINIGLLCVQEDPNCRPSMSTVVIMLGSETNPLPVPTQPAFVVRRRLSTASSSSSTKPDTISKNELTISHAQGR